MSVCSTLKKALNHFCLLCRDGNYCNEPAAVEELVHSDSQCPLFLLSSFRAAIEAAQQLERGETPSTTTESTTPTVSRLIKPTLATTSTTSRSTTTTIAMKTTTLSKSSTTDDNNSQHTATHHSSPRNEQQRAQSTAFVANSRHSELLGNDDNRAGLRPRDDKTIMRAGTNAGARLTIGLLGAFVMTLCSFAHRARFLTLTQEL